MTREKDESSSSTFDFYPEGYEIGRTKFIIVTGGVMSGVGKGVFTASLSHLLKSFGFAVTAVKIDGYLNIDAGTLNPYRHGETFVLNDGTECDLDLGTYERFLQTSLDRDNYMTSGKIYAHILKKERRGDYLGQDVQIVPHVTGEVKLFLRCRAYSGSYDIVLVEIGGTVGDIENLHFIEAARELQYEEGRENVMFAHVTLVPSSDTLGEQKSKPTQHSVKKLLELGIQPDLLACRVKGELEENVRNKLSLHCNVSKENVLSSPDLKNIYTLPSLLEKQGVGKSVLTRLGLPVPQHVHIPFSAYTDHIQKEHPQITVVIAGKYSTVRDSYLSITNALIHAERIVGVSINIEYVDTTNIDEDTLLPHFDGLIVPGGYGLRGTSGMIRLIQHARETKKPFLGLCFGFQLAIIEFARNVCGLHKATSSEFFPDAECPVIDLLPEQKGVDKFGGTQRLGLQTVLLSKWTRTANLYGAEIAYERFRHRYEFNNDYKNIFELYGMLFTGTSPDKRIMQICEYPAHPFFFATQFHPELLSDPLRAHPLFLEFVDCAYLQKGE